MKSEDVPIQEVKWMKSPGNSKPKTSEEKLAEKIASSQKLLDALAPMFEEAEEKKLYFWTSHGNEWFSPKELRVQQAAGCLLWGPSNWQLRCPKERLVELQLETRKWADATQRFHKKLLDEGYDLS